jgi:hypothetical protein
MKNLVKILPLVFGLALVACEDSKSLDISDPKKFLANNADEFSDYFKDLEETGIYLNDETTKTDEWLSTSKYFYSKAIKEYTTNTKYVRDTFKITNLGYIEHIETYDNIFSRFYKNNQTEIHLGDQIISNPTADRTFPLFEDKYVTYVADDKTEYYYYDFYVLGDMYVEINFSQAIEYNGRHKLYFAPAGKPSANGALPLMVIRADVFTRIVNGLSYDKAVLENTIHLALGEWPLNYPEELKK